MNYEVDVPIIETLSEYRDELMASDSELTTLGAIDAALSEIGAEPNHRRAWE